MIGLTSPWRTTQNTEIMESLMGMPLSWKQYPWTWSLPLKFSLFALSWGHVIKNTLYITKIELSRGENYMGPYSKTSCFMIEDGPILKMAPYVYFSKCNFRLKNFLVSYGPSSTRDGRRCLGRFDISTSRSRTTCQTSYRSNRWKSERNFKFVIIYDSKTNI